MEVIENSEQPMFPISTAARMLKISVHTLRMYEKEGLIIPFKKETNHRLYSRADIDRLNCIRKAINEFKISISGIKTIYSFIPCWQITNCNDEDRQNCNAFIVHNNPCWMFNHKKNICENKVCRECRVYKDYAECGDIKELIKNLTASQPQA
jgi:MerR family transcriptional regulator/heat shock protein HspR